MPKGKAQDIIFSFAFLLYKAKGKSQISGGKINPTLLNVGLILDALDLAPPEVRSNSSFKTG
ncbi:MAG: hypothetical protein V7K88_26345 [Nostoc sp.]|uniref:hypothetical protein n=1 Tax=Nostoc sp. TaxID=1180 RepID=UPI002FF81B3B